MVEGAVKVFHMAIPHWKTFRVLKTCLYQGFCADRAAREEARIRLTCCVVVHVRVSYETQTCHRPSGEAEKAGMKMRPTKLLIFGRPKAGTRMMLALRPSPSISP
jgi:hypothetical protein